VWAALRTGKGRVPVEYVEYEVMRHMGWSWTDLQETPWQVVDGIRRFMRTEAKYQSMNERRAHGGQ
jgi:hypothetical protein